MFTFDMLYPKPPSRALERKERTRDKARLRRIIWADVSKRDGYKCRHCGDRQGLHHHHLLFRSKGGNDTSRNLLLLCAVCHADVHGYRLTVKATTNRGADGEIRFETSR